MLSTPIVASLILSFAIGLNAQSGRPGGSRPTVPSTPRPSFPEYSPNSIWMSGKVVVDDGTLLTDPVAIQSICKGRMRLEVYTDLKGHFSIELKSRNQSNAVLQAAEDSSQNTVEGTAPTELSRRTNSTDPLRDYWRDCELQAVVPGFASETVQLAGKLTGDWGAVDVGTIPLHRNDKVQGLTVSVTSARAPSKARKEYEKGIELENKQKWDAALESFQKAIQVYPEYATAWFEMGRLQIRKNDSAGARESLQRALAADSKFVSPYHELALLAAHDEQWQEVVSATHELLKLDPIDFPNDYLLNAVGDFHLHQFDAAERSALRGLELDKQNRLPGLEYVLGLVLAQTHDYTGAVQHLRNYLRLSPTATDSQTVQKQIQDLQQLSSKASAQQ